MVRPELTDIRAHLAAQRWFGGDVASATVTEVERLDDDLMRLVLWDGTARWQLVSGDERALLHHVAPDLVVTTVRPIGVEQSNSSWVFDERWILKVFRRLDGVNPDAEMTEALAQVGFRHVAQPVRVWRRGGDDLAIVQPFLAGGADGWALALDALRAGVTFSEAFVKEARALGATTAAMHRKLAEAFGTWPASAHEWADGIVERSLAVAHPAVTGIDAAVRPMRGISDAGRAIRIHGDYHLGQVLRASGAWWVLDFEGEPSRPSYERRRPHSPLRDVAGMLRSFAYAAAQGNATAEWEHAMRNSFLDAYFDGVRGTGLVPADPRVLLDAFELDKAVYELGYEQAYRPDWIDIPLRAVTARVGR